ncbi:MAG: ABC transporter substrate-binding protein [Gaiellales bacterium]
MSEEMEKESTLLNTTMSRKGFVAMSGAAGLAAFLAACGGSSSSSSSSSGGDAAASGDASGESASGPKFDPAKDPGGPIEIFTWAGYDDSPKDGLPAMWAEYEKGPYNSTSPLKFTFLEDDQQALAKVASGYSPDIIHPCIAYTVQWTEAGLIQPFDMSLLPDFDGIPEAIYAGGVIDGQNYHMPFDVGFSCLTYDADAISFDKVGGKESWEILLDDTYKGKMAIFSDDAAIIKIGFLINEGAVDPNVLTSDQIAKAKETALKIKPNLRNYWTSQTDTVNDFVNGNLVATYTWPDGYWKIKNHPKMKDRNIKYMQPTQGRLAWVCGMVLSAATKNPGIASTAMASANTPAAGAALTDNFQYSSGQQKGVADLIQNKDLVEAFQINDPSAWAPPNAWFEAPLPNYKDFVTAGEEVKNS